MNIGLIITTEATEEQLKLINDYWLYEKGKPVYTVKEIATKYNLEYHIVSKYVRTIGYAENKSIKCVSCNEKNYIYTSRSALAEKYKTRNWVCDYCKSKQEQEAEERKQKREKEKYSRVLQSYFFASENASSLEDIKIDNLLVLYSLFRVLGNENFSYILPLESIKAGDEFFSPNKEWDKDLLLQLKENNIICINPDSDEKAIIIGDNNKGNSFSYYPYEVMWRCVIRDFDEDPENMFLEIRSILISEYEKNHRVSMK